MFVRRCWGSIGISTSIMNSFVPTDALHFKEFSESAETMRSTCIAVNNNNFERWIVILWAKCRERPSKCKQFARFFFVVVVRFPLVAVLWLLCFGCFCFSICCSTYFVFIPVNLTTSTFHREQLFNCILVILSFVRSFFGTFYARNTDCIHGVRSDFLLLFFLFIRTTHQASEHITNLL